MVECCVKHHNPNLTPNWRGNQKWIIKRYKQNYAHKTQDEKKQKQLSAENFKEEHNEHHQKSRVNPGAREGYAVKSIHVAEANTGFY